MLDGHCPAGTFKFRDVYENLSNHIERKNKVYPYQYEVCFYPANSHYVFPNGYLNDEKIIRDLLVTFKARGSLGSQGRFRKVVSRKSVTTEQVAMDSYGTRKGTNPSIAHADEFPKKKWVVLDSNQQPSA